MRYPYVERKYPYIPKEYYEPVRLVFKLMYQKWNRRTAITMASTTFRCDREELERYVAEREKAKNGGG